MIGINNKYVVVPLWAPADKTNPAIGDIISLKNYNQAELYIQTGATFAKTAAVTLHQGISVSSCATALAFTLYYETGMMLKYDGASSSIPAAAGETATGAATGVMTIREDRGGILVGNKWNSTAFVDNEVLTFSGGKTAVVDGIRYNEDIMVPTVLAVGVNTFDITLDIDINKIYCIPVNSSMLAPGMDCIELNIGDMDTVSVVAAWAILSEPRYIGIPGETAIYN